MTKREKHLGMSLVSAVAGTLIALMLIMTVPDLQRNAEMVIYFFIYWLLGAFATYLAIDLLQMLKAGESDADKAC